MILIVVPGEPIGRQTVKVRVVKARDGRAFASTYTPAKTRAEDGAIRLIAATAMGGQPPLSGPIILHLCAYRSVPASWSKRKRAEAIGGMLFPTQKPDLDNCMKMLDAVKGIVWIDDAQICSAHIHKRFSDRPRLEINVEKMEPEL